MLVFYAACAFCSSLWSSIDLPSVAKAESVMPPLVVSIADFLRRLGDIFEIMTAFYALLNIALLAILLSKGKTIAVLGLLITLVALFCGTYLKSFISHSLHALEMGAISQHPNLLGTTIGFLTTFVTFAFVSGALLLVGTFCNRVFKSCWRRRN